MRVQCKSARMLGFQEANAYVYFRSLAGSGSRNCSSSPAASIGPASMKQACDRLLLICSSVCSDPKLGHHST